MGMSDTQRFLVEAKRVAREDGTFETGSVGTKLGFSIAQSSSAIQSLGERKLLVALVGPHARLLDAGQQLATKLQMKQSAREQGSGSRR
jgi:hypothetical protein